MKILATFDARNYQDTAAVLEKYSVRAIIVREGKLALQRSTAGEYKLPGGGPEPGEDFGQALIREVHEETGLRVIQDSVRELGEILEMRKDIFEADKKYICHSLFYFCRVEEIQDELQLTASEKEKGYHLEWAEPEKIILQNAAFADMPWIVRDTAFVKMIVQKRVVLPEESCLVLHG